MVSRNLLQWRAEWACLPLNFNSFGSGNFYGGLVNTNQQQKNLVFLPLCPTRLIFFVTTCSVHNIDLLFALQSLVPFSLFFFFGSNLPSSPCSQSSDFILMKPVWTSLFNTQSGPGTQFPEFALLFSAFLSHRTYFLLTEHKISLLIFFLVHGLLSLFTRPHSPGCKCHRAGHLYFAWKVEYSIILLHFLHNIPNEWFALYFKFRWCDHCLNNPLTKRRYFLLYRPVLPN